jgi:RNA polymerase sigma factor (sigma-70 family)
MPSPSVTLLRTQSDDRLVALAAAGHERAFEAIVERYRRQLLRHARRYLPEARAEDAMQQALVSAWTALRRGDDVREPRAWLHRIVHNSALNTLRTPGYDYEELRATLEGSGGPAELSERRAVVHGTLAGLAALPERQREALLQIAVEGRSQDEVAAQLGLSQGAVRQLVHRARTTLRAAATAVVPLPLATWLATAGAGRGDIAVRVGELAAGAGGSATLAKAGAVAVIAGGAVAGPAVVHDVTDRAQRPAASGHATDARATDERGGTDVRPASTASARPVSAGDPVVVSALVARHASAPERTGSQTRRHKHRSRARKHDRTAGSRGGDEDDRSGRRREDDDDHHWSGSRHHDDVGDDWSGSRRSGSDDRDDDGHSGSSGDWRSGDDDWSGHQRDGRSEDGDGEESAPSGDDAPDDGIGPALSATPQPSGDDGPDAPEPEAAAPATPEPDDDSSGSSDSGSSGE